MELKLKILFLGEGALSGPARYLAAILKGSACSFDRLEDKEEIPGEWFKRHYDAIILSDYRYAGFTVGSESWLVQQVDEGAGLLMIGGWASFTGLAGHYKGSSIENLLPVSCVHGDDRVNRAGGAVLLPFGEHPATANLNWSKPPVVCGYHHVQVKEKTRTLLAFHDLDFTESRPRLGASHPALVVGSAGQGRTAAFLTDCAPHWAGGLVDWGDERVTVNLGRDNVVEMGDQYLKFFSQLLKWLVTGQTPKP